MDRTSIYYKQVQLLMQCLPFVAEQDCFALKGGTAINLFVRELPRLSVDIDLVYLPIKSRDEALQEIRTSLESIGRNLTMRLKDVEVTEAYKSKSDSLRLIVSQNDNLIKIELSPVLRGTVFEPALKEVCEPVEEEFGYAEMTVVSLADLYAGKICAALDRQHPRDLFDIKWLLDNEGLTEEIRKTFLVYLVSHNRPIAELLRPEYKDISSLYDGEFANMSQISVSKEDLILTRERLVDVIHQGMTEDEKQFLISFKSRKPEWKLLGLSGVENLPAIKWKQINLSKMPSKKHTEALDKLKDVLMK